MYYLAYNVLLSLVLAAGLPLLPVWLLWRSRFRPGLAERFAWYAKSKLEKLEGSYPVWIHAASVGEVLSASTLIAALKSEAPDRNVIVSTFTATGNAMARRCAGADMVFFLPLDHPLTVRRALNRLHPAVLIVIETEIWPNLLHQAFKLGIPTLLLSGRLSERALKRYLIFRGFFRHVIGCFSALGMQSDEDRLRIIGLGAEAKRVTVTGNLKRAAQISGVRDSSEANQGGAVRGTLATRQLLVAGSSHRGEEAMLLGAFATLKEQFPGLQLALAPRHPERFAEVEGLLRSSGLSFEKKNLIADRVTFDQDVLLINTLGDLSKFYARADVAFVGGSLIDAGGHNLLEPAFFKKPVAFGPYMANFRLLADEMKDCGGGIEVRDAASLLREIGALLQDPDRCRSMGEKAYLVAARDDGVLERSLELVRCYVDFAPVEAAPLANGAIVSAYE